MDHDASSGKNLIVFGLRRYALNYLFLGVICFLFRPSFNSTRFAYSELEGAHTPDLSLVMCKAFLNSDAL